MKQLKSMKNTSFSMILTRFAIEKWNFPEYKHTINSKISKNKNTGVL